MQIGGTNYLIPIDAKLETDRDVPFEAISLDQVQNAIEGAHKLGSSQIFPKSYAKDRPGTAPTILGRR